MKSAIRRSRPRKVTWRDLVAICCSVLLVPGEAMVVLAQEKPAETPQQAPAASETPPAQAASGPAPAPKIPPEQLESLVAPIALYPDPLLAQTLVASTYPLEIIQLHQYLQKHPNLKDQALADSVAIQPWDPSIQSMAALPDVVKRLADDIQWTTELGNAFLAQQSEVMDAVQRMRKKAKDNGALETNEQQKVETKVVEEKTVIVVESSNPEVIYVPSYSPTVVYGPPVYPYPPIYYPYYPPGAAFVSFGIGMMWGAAMWGGSCCGCGWGSSYNNVNINVDNNFNRIEHNRGDRGDRGDRGGDRGGDRAQNKAGGAGDRGGGGNWQHNPSHRGGAPYGDRQTADKFGGSARGDARPAASQQPARGGAGGGAGAGNRAGSPSAGNRASGVSDRSAGGAGGAGISDRSAGGAGSRGGDNIGNRSIPKSSGSKSGFSSGSRGYSGSSARSSSSRGSSSMGSRGGGGGRGGGGRGGGGRR